METHIWTYHNIIWLKFMRTSCCRPMHCRWNTTGAFFDPPTALYHSYHGTRKVPLGWIEDHSKAYSSLELTVVIAWSENKAPQNPGGLWWFMYVYVLWCSSSKWPFRGTCGRYASFLDTYRIVGYVSHYIQKNMSGLSLERPWLGVNPFNGVLSTL